MKLDNQSYRLTHLLLRLPTTPGNYIFLTLHGSNHHFSLIEDATLKLGSLTVTPSSVSVALSKEVEMFESKGSVGVDTNERNVTTSATDGWCRRFNELGEVVEIKEAYKLVTSRIARHTGRDRRTCQRLLAKYGERERGRTNQRLHKVTREIITYAEGNLLGIKMENLRGIRKLYRRGNGQGAIFRGRMNSWVFGETRRQMDYKAKWDGVPLWFVSPRGTSSYCLCGSCVVRLAERRLYCPKCDRTWDRDDLAGRRIMACAVPQVRPSTGSSEGERVDASIPLSRWKEGRPNGRKSSRDSRT